jgi:hypothetical protein
MLFLIFSKNIFTLIKKGQIAALSNYFYYKRWKRSLLATSNSVADEQAWITFPAIDFIEKNTPGGSKVFEYGGGGSTLFFLKLNAAVITVEHNTAWFKILKDTIKTKDWQGHLVEPEVKDPSSILSISRPGDYFSADPDFKDHTFKNYASFIDEFPDKTFDIVLVDGRARTSCLKHSINKVKQHGFLILDNSDRKYYTSEQEDVLNNNFSLLLSTTAATPYLKHFSQTTIWKKK